tara:strand:- start:726 stop:1082 length:357 start_codon:yes stop_codon:yes gene_type:complete
MVTGISLDDGSYVEITQIAYVKPDVRNWCKVVLENGFEFECQSYDRIKAAFDTYKSTQKSKAIKFRVNYTRINGKRASFDCSASNEIDAIVKLEKNRANYNETLLQLSNISIKLSPQK